jgi:hypothetical protein
MKVPGRHTVCVRVCVRASGRYSNGLCLPVGAPTRNIRDHAESRPTCRRRRWHNARRQSGSGSHLPVTKETAWQCVYSSTKVTGDHTDNIHYLLHYDAGYYFKSWSLLSSSKISRFLMEPEGSSPCSQKPATGPYPEPAESSSAHRSLSPKGPS